MGSPFFAARHAALARRRAAAIVPPMSLRSLAIASLLAAGCLRPPPVEGVAPRGDGSAPARRLLDARGPGEIYQRGEVRAFALRQGGQRIGGSWGRYAGP